MGTIRMINVMTGASRVGDAAAGGCCGASHVNERCVVCVV